MPILGTFIDRFTTSRAPDMLASSTGGRAGANVTLTTAPHSLPNTIAEAIFMNLRSVQGGDDFGVPDLIGLGGNQSLNTIGFAVGGVSVNTAATVMFDVYSLTWHSIIR